MKRLSILIVLLLSTTMVNAQSSTIPADSAYSAPSTPTLRLKPRLGLGVGTFTFFGDVGGDTKGYSPLSSNFGYHVRLSNELSPYFDLSFQAIFGSFTVNEINTDRRYNFQSEIRTGGVALSYNFGHFLPKDRFIEPWVSVGIESLEFLSKTDLYDANGNMYHYWSDGTIRNIAEDAFNASEAVLLRRDYSYETDLRELNADGLGKYQERNWAIPVGVGVNLRMTDRFRTRIGATMHYSMTDLIDNVSAAGEGVRAGNNQNDKYLYASIALNYDLSVTPKEKPAPIMFMDDDGNLIALELGDWDKDGVGDLEDKCPGTPEGAPVDKYGCPVDTDGDGFADYMDQEPNSLAGSIVDAEGVAMTDDEVETRWLAWTDSIPWREYAGVESFKEDFAQVMFDPSRKSDDQLEYTVQIGVSDRGLTQAEINALLSLKDIKHIERGGEDMYVVGSFDELPEAVKRKMELDQQGISGSVRYDNGEEMMNMDAQAMSVENKLREEMDFPVAENSEDVIYRVQLGAFRFDLSENIFAGIDDVVKVVGDDDLARYTSGSFNSAQEAASHKAKMLLAGFDGAFITAYQGGKRIRLTDAGMSVKEGAEDLIVDKPMSTVNKEFISFSVELGAFEGNIPTEILSAFLELGKVRPVRGADGITNYLHGKFNTREEAEEAARRIHDEGLPGAFVIGDFNGKLIPADQAEKLLSGDDDGVLLMEELESEE